MKVQLGQYGYLKKQKIQYIVKIVLCILMGVILFLAGYFINDGNSKNICTVLAILMSLPLAKEFTELVVIFPFFDVEKSRYEKIKSLCPRQAMLMTGLVITSERKVMNLEFLVECEGNVLALTRKTEKELSYISNYLTKGVRNWGFDYNVKVFKEEKAFLRAMESMKPVAVSEEVKKNVISYLKSLIVK